MLILAAYPRTSGQLYALTRNEFIDEHMYKNDFLCYLYHVPASSMVFGE